MAQLKDIAWQYSESFVLVRSREELEQYVRCLGGAEVRDFANYDPVILREVRARLDSGMQVVLMAAGKDRVLFIANANLLEEKMSVEERGIHRDRVQACEDLLTGNVTEDTVQTLDLWTQSEPDRAGAWSNLGKALVKRYEDMTDTAKTHVALAAWEEVESKAIKALEKAILLGDSNGSTLLARAKMAMYTDDARKARRHAKQVLNRNPTKGQKEIAEHILGKVGSGCFIATAAYASDSHDNVLLLSDFRDRFLLRCAPGRLFVKTYYWFSPSVSVFVENNSVVAWFVRTALLGPASALVWCFVYKRNHG